MANGSGELYGADRDAEIRELTALMARQIPVVLAAVVIVGVTALCVVESVHADLGWTGPWLASLLVVTAARAGMLVAYRLAADRFGPLFWKAGFTLASLFSGCLFGLFGWHVVSLGNSLLTAFAIMMLTGLTAGSLASLSALRAVYAAFAISAMGPVIVWFALRPQAAEQAMAILGLAFLLTHLGYSQLQNGTFRDLIRLRDHERRLVSEIAEARDRAERSSQEKTRFLLAAGHDLRQPLYAMRLLLDTLEGADMEHRRARIASIVQSADAIRDLLDRMLEAARAGVGGYAPHMGIVRMDDILRQVSLEFAADAAAKSLDFCVVGTRRAVRTDPVLLTQILRNFVGNAVRHTQHGRVLIGARPRGNRLSLQVWDTGPGIHADDIPTIFEPFRQLSNPGRQARRGHGLGLTIARGMAEIIGAPIEVRSWPGRGSMFAITVDLAVGGTIPSSEERLDRKRQAGPPVHEEGVVVLVVEDHPTARAVLVDILEGWGYRTIEAQDSDAALKAVVRAGPAPDIIVTDLRLPGAVDGMSLIARMRARFGRPIPALVVTGDPLAPEPDSDIIVLRKPISSGELAAALASMRNLPENAGA
ncbi:ATP-binding protein [Alsobacter sp. SYSU M60028]|uniref:histidine kinase n=1 Tax=Alsobacter ponti TaxID=2962936 RepID=A0ABT1LDB9_9HYPH|nr:ATP-binding protein [Alsobacter ponti]MCP8939505.1 ATP-binding protein [Alsobacter ponti]